jgi:hypothetical protein
VVSKKGTVRVPVIPFFEDIPEPVGPVDQPQSAERVGESSLIHGGKIRKKAEIGKMERTLAVLLPYRLDGPDGKKRR